MSQPRTGDGGWAARFEAAIVLLSRGASALATVSVLIALLLVCAGVVARYAFNTPLPWTDEVSGWLIVATVMLAIGEVQRRGENIGVDLVLEKARPRPRRALELLGVACVAASALLLTAQGTETVAFSRMLGLKPLAFAWIDIWWIQLLVPVGSALLLAVSVMQLALLAMGRRPRDFDSTGIKGLHE